MATGTERVDIWTCPPHARASLTDDAIDYMKQNGMWPDDGNGGVLVEMDLVIILVMAMVSMCASQIMS